MEKNYNKALPYAKKGLKVSWNGKMKEVQKSKEMDHILNVMRWKLQLKQWKDLLTPVCKEAWQQVYFHVTENFRTEDAWYIFRTFVRVRFTVR